VSVETTGPVSLINSLVRTQPSQSESFGKALASNAFIHTGSQAKLINFDLGSDKLMHNTSDEDLVSREHETRLRECEELERLIGERCREAEMRWYAAHPWLSSAPLRSHAWCVSVPVALRAI
jgi:hypothetical protein